MSAVATGGNGVDGVGQEAGTAHESDDTDGGAFQ